MKTMVKAREQAMKRLYGLLELQKDLEQRFDPNQYNIFVFGSYITVNYIEGVSDIDVAVYTEDFDLYKKISLYIEEYFEKRQVKSDIFYIDINMAAPVYTDTMKSKVHLTLFYTPCYEEYRKACQKVLDQTKMRMMS